MINVIGASLSSIACSHQAKRSMKVKRWAWAFADGSGPTISTLMYWNVTWNADV